MVYGLHKPLFLRLFKYIIKLYINTRLTLIMGSSNLSNNYKPFLYINTPEFKNLNNSVSSFLLTVSESMATATSSSLVETYSIGHNTFFTAKPSSTTIFPRSLSTLQPTQKRKKKSLSVCMVMEKRREKQKVVETENPVTEVSRAEQRLARKRSERQTYLVAAIMSSLGISSMAVLSVYYRFSWQMEGGELQLVEMVGTFALSVGAAVGMEFWARWAHRALWHASLWHMHESHHRPRDGPFELNDVFAITNALPAIALLSYGLFNKGLVPGLCFGAGLGITVFGMAYMFVHDGLVHRRFPVGPIADVPYLRRVAAAHQLHHSEKFYGLPYGLFMGPQEIEEAGGREELEKEIQRLTKRSKGSQ
ncbi:hypothetical protein Dsin_007734 [Dipteronia sinensis]|uniref:beta-carotene 3-hydroxylase n=1 Tax=Dipteronia sinensis TaxID=43782 RepID=A0AAE0EHD1_9ROSI|nr:hypothetical protein Dsin_007734 [Dipteronia sinensis]